MIQGNPLDMISKIFASTPAVAPKAVTPTPTAGYLPGQYEWIRDHPALLKYHTPKEAATLYRQAVTAPGGHYYGVSPTGVPTTTPTPTIPQSVPSPTQTPQFKGFKTAPVPPQYSDLILKSAQQSKIPPQVLASLLFTESGFRPNAKNSNRDAQGNPIPGNIDRGIAQINSMAHPDVSDDQANDPNYAIPWAAHALGSYINNLGINRGIAAYNVGQGGASIQGPGTAGLGPKGQAYLDKVSAGLSPDFRQQLGIKTNAQ